MSPIFFVSLPFILLILISRGATATSAKVKPTQPTEKVIDIITHQDDHIIIVRKNKH